jgi:hypothetical protein
MGLFSRKKRHVVATIHLGVTGDSTRVAHLLSSVREAIGQIRHANDFYAISRSLARVLAHLIEQEGLWTHIYNAGEVFEKEEDADAYAQRIFAEDANRYLAAVTPIDTSGEHRHIVGMPTPPNPFEPAVQRAVIMITAGYTGTSDEIETTLSSRDQVRQALEALLGLHHNDGLMLAQIHVSPGNAHDRLTEDQFLVNFPDMVTL